jgi:hypothetical protein
VVSFMPLALNPREKVHSTHSIEGWLDPGVSFDVVEKQFLYSFSMADVHFTRNFKF